MKVAVVLEQRFLLAADGSVWTSDALAYSSWRRYLRTFDEVQIVARARGVDKRPVQGTRVDGAGVTLTAIPTYLGPQQFVAKARRVRSALRRAFAEPDAVILRVPGTLSNLAFPMLRRNGHPFGVEVVGDPAGVFASGAVGGPLHTLLRHWFVKSLAEQCSHAAVAIYVTQRTLQERYPPSPKGFTTHCSNIELAPGATATSPPAVRDHGPYRIVTVGSLEQLYKGVDTLLLAVRRCIDSGITLSLDIIGDGRFRPQLEALALKEDLSRVVTFLGTLPGQAAVRHRTTGADLFVLASRTEGLPRALIEAMAQGIPCVATSVGGIPELLAPDDLVAPSAPRELASRICEVLGDPVRRRAMSERNLTTAMEFQEPLLDARRQRAYGELAARTHRRE